MLLRKLAWELILGPYRTATEDPCQECHLDTESAGIGICAVAKHRHAPVVCRKAKHHRAEADIGAVMPDHRQSLNRAQYQPPRI